MKFNEPFKPRQENFSSNKEKKEQAPKSKRYFENPKDKFFKERIKKERREEKNIPGSKIEIGFKREKLCFEALQELKREGKIIDILPMGMVGPNGEFNENPTDLDVHEQTDFLITISSGGRIKFVKISVKPPNVKNSYNIKADIFLNISLRDTTEEIKEQIEQELANFS